MATQIGKPQEMAEVGDLSHPWAGKGYQVRPTVDRGPNDSGCPFETKRPIPYNIIEGGGYISGKDGPKWPERQYAVDEEALKLIKARNVVPGGFATESTVTLDELAARHTVKQAAQAVAPAVLPTPQRPQLPVPQTLHETPQSAKVLAEARAAIPPPKAVLMGPPPQQTSSLPEQFVQVIGPGFPVDATPHPTEPPLGTHYEPQGYQAPKPRNAVKFRGRFGTLTAPYDLVFVDDLSLVLVQYAIDGVYYEPPYDPEEPMEISWAGRRYLCHSGIHYKMPDGRAAHTVYLIERDLNVEEAQ